MARDKYFAFFVSLVEFVENIKNLYPLVPFEVLAAFPHIKLCLVL